MDGAVKFVLRNLATLSNFVEFRDSRNILRISRRRVGLAKFDTTREHDTNPTRFLRVWVEYNRVWVISVLTRLTRLINGLYSC